MKKNFNWGKKLLMAAVCFTLSAGFIYAESNPKPFVIPELKSWQGAEGSKNIRTTNYHTLPSFRNISVLTRLLVT